MKQNKNVYIKMNTLKGLLFAFIDLIIVFASYLLGVLAQFDIVTTSLMIFILAVAVSQVIIFLLFRNYGTLTSNFGLADAVRFSLIILLVNVLTAVVNRFILTDMENITIYTFILITAIEEVLIITSRTLSRLFRFYSTGSKDDKRTAIIGAGSAGKLIFDEIHNNPLLKNNVICFIDFDKDKIGKRYLGKKVLGPIENVHEIIEKNNIEEVIIAISDLSKDRLQYFLSYLKEEKVVIKRLPLLTENKLDENSVKLQNISLAELLGRDEIVFDTKDISKFILGRRVLVTGAGGSIGSELVRQIFSYFPSELILFDIYENSTYDIQQELVRRIRKDNLNIKLYTIIGSTYNEKRVEEIFSKYKPEIVFHAAAYKHVPLMEDSPVEAIRTNIFGTYNVAKMVDKYHAIKMVLVSTDKAVRPTNTMGATKAFAEMIIRYFSSISKSSYSAVRFGNVLGSNGSVIPLFKKQIEEGGPVTVTHKDIIRYFMTIPEAVSLILQSGVYATGGEIFILDMGEPVKILTLAENVIKQAGLRPYIDIDIVFTGLRPGEKLFEELLLSTKDHTPTDNKKIFIEKKNNIHDINQDLEYLKGVFDKTDNDEIKDMLKHVVTSFTDYQEFNKNINNK